ncbi:MAG: hypothetical protein HKO66_02960 [Saprospiraceae bacterium]|nr:hypothetical protein [Bacteroidia bacterium]NNE14049.1 hypothetical protein [Saprospiraceae bacterium]NNL91174.1 hypothetical protein [Saprospiraceae bacterium]
MFKSNKFFPILLFIFSICLFACGDDGDSNEITGCMDPAADNYNPNATVDGNCEYSGCTDPDAENYNELATTDDNSCIYARDKFIGTYLGSFTCPGFIGAAVNTDSIVVTIENGLDANLKNQVIITLLDVSGFDIPLTATAQADSLFDIAAELPGIPINSLPGTYDVKGTGLAAISSDETTLSATVILDIANTDPNSGIVINSECELVAIKQ